MNSYEVNVCFKFNGEVLINKEFSCNLRTKPNSDQDFQKLLEILASLDAVCQKIAATDRIYTLVKSNY